LFLNVGDFSFDEHGVEGSYVKVKAI